MLASRHRLSSHLRSRHSQASGEQQIHQAKRDTSLSNHDIQSFGHSGCFIIQVTPWVVGWSVLILPLNLSAQVIEVINDHLDS